MINSTNDIDDLSDEDKELYKIAVGKWSHVLLLIFLAIILILIWLLAMFGYISRTTFHFALFSHFIFTILLVSIRSFIFRRRFSKALQKLNKKRASK